VIAVPFLLGGARGTTHVAFWVAMATLGFLQVTASILNFLPVPGLDGGNIIRPWLNQQYQRAYALFAPYGFLLLFVLLWQSRINYYFFNLVATITNAIGIPADVGRIGLQYMRFWTNF
jgi:Zn-dependent protease